MAKENQSPWDSQKQVNIIYMIGILGSDWLPEMSEQEVIAAYQLAMNPVDENPAKMEVV